jgi:HEAT repeat protein
MAVINFMVIAAAAVLSLSGATTGAEVVPGASVERGDVPKSWAPADVADSIWKAGRNAISDEDWRAAQKLFSRIHENYPKSAYAADSYYWEAFALSRRGGNDNVHDAVSLLEKQIERFANASSVKNGDSKSLLTRLQGTLARGGDASAAADISARAGRASRSYGGTGGSGGSGGSGANRSSRASTPPGCKSEEDDDRVEALNALLQMGSDDALPILKKVLARRDPCSEILRRKAVFLVSQKRGDEPADMLVDAAKNDPDAEVREQAVFWLSQVSSSKAVPLLEQILKTSTDQNMQDKALFSLSQKSDDRAQQALRDFASREDLPSNLRDNAIFWLGQRRSDGNAKFLRDLFAKTSSNAAREKIIFSISQTNTSGNDQWLLDQAVNTKNSMDIRKNALFWAGQNGSLDMARIGVLYDKATETEFKKQVIFVLSQRGKSSEAVDKLIDIAKTEKDKELRKEALFWLSQSHDPRVAKFLLDIINK